MLCSSITVLFLITQLQNAIPFHSYLTDESCVEKHILQKYIIVVSQHSPHSLSFSLSLMPNFLFLFCLYTFYFQSLSLSPEEQDLRNPKLVQIYLNFDSDILLCFLCFNISNFWYLFSSCIYLISPVVINGPFRFLYCDIFNIIMKCLEKTNALFSLFWSLLY